jgi:hypothetical protein
MCDMGHIEGSSWTNGVSVKGSSVLAVGVEVSSLAKYSAKASLTGEDGAVEGKIEPRGGGDPAAWSSLRTGSAAVQYSS